MNSRADVYTALAQKTGFEVVNEKETTGQLRVVGRCHPDRWPFFQLVIFTLLNKSDNPQVAWTCDVSKQYVSQGGRLLYAWRLIFQSADISKVYADVSETIRNAPSPARTEVDTVLLPGYKPGQMRGGVNAKGKGSSEAGSMPMAVTRRR